LKQQHQTSAHKIHLKTLDGPKTQHVTPWQDGQQHKYKDCHRTTKSLDGSQEHVQMRRSEPSLNLIKKDLIQLTVGQNPTQHHHNDHLHPKPTGHRFQLM
jgi:hypothetical protein